MKVFISGGCKNGKSLYAQNIALAEPSRPLYYIATMKRADEEDDKRIAMHKLERAGCGFETIEQSKRIEDILHKCDPKGSFLLDSLTALLANEMFTAATGVSHNAVIRIIEGLKKIARSVENIVIVSDNIYSDAAVYDALTEEYRKSLAMIDREAAKLSDLVIEVSYSGLIFHKTVNRSKEIDDTDFWRILSGETGIRP